MVVGFEFFYCNVVGSELKYSEVLVIWSWIWIFDLLDVMIDKFWMNLIINVVKWMMNRMCFRWMVNVVIFGIYLSVN